MIELFKAIALVTSFVFFANASAGEIKLSKYGSVELVNGKEKMSLTRDKRVEVPSAIKGMEKIGHHYSENIMNEEYQLIGTKRELLEIIAMNTVYVRNQQDEEGSFWEEKHDFIKRRLIMSGVSNFIENCDQAKGGFKQIAFPVNNKCECLVTVNCQVHKGAGVAFTQGRRIEMCDEYCVHTIKANGSKLEVSCVFDGNGGGGVSKYLKDNYVKRFEARLKEFSDSNDTNDLLSIAHAMSVSLVDLDVELLNVGIDGQLVQDVNDSIGFRAGSTANIAVFNKTDKTLLVANTGDSRAIYIGAQPFPLNKRQSFLKNSICHQNL